MRSRLMSTVVLLAAASVALPATGQMALRADGLEFPDGSIQTSAAEPAGLPVQAKQPVTIPDLEFCSAWTPLYAVPASSELLIEWISVEIKVYSPFPTVEVDLRAHDLSGSIDHALARLTDATSMVLYASQRWTSPVAIHSTGGQTVEFRGCRNTDTGDSVVLVSFSGRRFDLAP